MNRSRALLAAVIVGGALTGWSVAELTGPERLPFGAIRWIAGRPSVETRSGWEPLRAVSGVAVDEIVADAARRSGPAFAEVFPRLLVSTLNAENGWMGPAVTVTTGAGRREWRMATRSNWRRVGGVPLWRWSAGDRLSADAVRADLAMLADLIQNRLASEVAVAWRAELALVEARAAAGLERRDLTAAIMRVMAKFEDGHVRVVDRTSRQALPVRFVPVEEGFACVLRTNELCDAGCPLLAAIDGVAIGTLVERLRDLVPAVSPDYQRSGIAKLLAEDGFGFHDRRRSVNLELQGRARCLRSVDAGPRAEQISTPHLVVRRLSSGIAYLGFRAGWPADDWFARQLDAALETIGASSGLVIDVRGNDGGDRRPVLRLLRHFIPGSAAVDVAAYRMDTANRPPVEADVLALRDLHPAAPRWFQGPALDAALRARDRARAQRPLATDAWSDWHVGVLQGAGAAYDEPVVVLVDEASASATQLLVSTLATRPNVVVAGLSGGGGSGWPISRRLPKSGLVITLPSMLSRAPDGTARAAIAPLVRHPRTLDTLRRELAGEDPLLTWAEASLRSGSASGIEEHRPRNAEALNRQE